MQKTKSSSLAFDWRNSDSSVISNFFSLNLEKFKINERNFYASYLKENFGTYKLSMQFSQFPQSA
jgi:hypothetical protein